MASSSAGPADRFPGGAGEAEQEQGPFPQLCYHHVPQQSRRGKFRFPQEQGLDLDGRMDRPAFSLSLHSAASRVGRPAPLGPFTGYAAVLGRSRFLEPARRLLEEVCKVGQQRRRAGSGGDVALSVNPAESPPGSSPVSRLNSVLDEVYRRYKQHYHQAQAVINSFESIAGLNDAAPYASIALDAMAKHFQCLRNIITGRLHQVNNALDSEGITSEPITSSMRSNSSDGYFHRPTKVVAVPFTQPHGWRPQRGLPERAVAVLRGWLFEHFLHPYPTDADKQNLARQTGLTRNQVSNWFINARVRLWKPMVEEVHTLEMCKKSKISQSNNCCSSSSQNDHTHPPFNKSIQEPSLSPTSSSHGNGVLLTLGLHRNDGACFPESLLTLEDRSDGYLSSALGGHHPEQAVKVGGNRSIQNCTNLSLPQV
ncbi:BEL1-like homeodomain protein 9 [Curcuma longa]|uniref:BEL1-like homeodomain protein 9 n=1 Tax=Curcuma longa TaxID=136217 RepID=UPI003D9DBD7D